MALNQLTILQDMPLFQGHPRRDEPRFKPDVDARTFLRSVEVYFEQHDITDDKKKMQIVFSLIDKKRGDAIKLLTCYAGKKITFEEFKQQLLSIYPVFRLDEFKHAAQALLATKLEATDMFCSMTSLETASRAVAYLNSEKLTRNEFNVNSNIELATEADDASQASNQRDDDTAPLQLAELLQNFVMHLFIASQTANKVYDKISHLGPRNSSTKVMAETVKAAERHTLNTVRTPVKKKDEVIWRAEHNSERPAARYVPAKQSPPMYKPQTPPMYKQQSPPPYPQPSQHRYAPRQPLTKPSQPNPQYQEPARAQPSATTLCFNCGQTGHFRKDCNSCSYCRIKGHTQKTCIRRQKDAKGKFCANCRIRDSHDTRECRNILQNSNRNRVRLAEVIDEHGPNNEYWQFDDPTIHEFPVDELQDHPELYEYEEPFDNKEQLVQEEQLMHDGTEESS